MNTLLKRWRSITIGFLLVTYLTVIVYMHQPLRTWLIIAGCWVLLTILLYLGTFIGIIGILLQSITRRQEPSIPLFKTAYRLGTRNATILASYGLLMLRDEKAEEGLNCFERALEASNYFLTTKTLLCNKGIALWKLGRTDEAIDSYMEAMEKFGTDGQNFFSDRTLDQEGIDDLITSNSYFYPQDYTTIGFFHTLQGDYELAEFFSKAALAKEDNYAAAFDNLGQIEYFKGHMDTAEEHFQKALELNETLPDSLYYSGLVALKKGDEEKAKDYLTQARACKLDGLNTISYKMIDEAMASI